MRERSPTVLVMVSLGLAVTIGACGKLKPEGGDDGGAGTGAAGTGAAGAGAAGTGGVSGPAHVIVSGTAEPHPLNALLAATDDFTGIKVAIVNPTAVLADPAAAPLASVTLDTTAGNCDATTGACGFSLSAVDITDVTLGLVGTLEDLRAGAARLWVKTGTGLGTAAFITQEKKTHAPITMRRAFAVSRKLEAKLAAFAGTALGTAIPAGELERRGFLIGHVVDKLSTAAEPAGVAGATVTATGSFDIIYPNDAFTAKGAATASKGIFLMVPKAATTTDAIVASWKVVPPAGDPRTWVDYIAGSNPGNAFVIIMPANE